MLYFSLVAGEVEVYETTSDTLIKMSLAYFVVTDHLWFLTVVEIILRCNCAL